MIHDEKSCIDNSTFKKLNINKYFLSNANMASLDRRSGGAVGLVDDLRRARVMNLRVVTTNVGMRES